MVAGIGRKNIDNIETKSGTKIILPPRQGRLKDCIKFFCLHDILECYWSFSWKLFGSFPICKELNSALKYFFWQMLFKLNSVYCSHFLFHGKKRLHIFVIIERANVMSKSCEVCGRLKWTQKCNVHVCLSCEIASEIMNKFINLKTRNN